MRLNQATDFALRILMLLANADEPKTVGEIADELGLVKSHVMKIVAKLTNSNYLISTRGRNGGVQIGQSPEKIDIGRVVRLMEPDFAVVECMNSGKSTCSFMPSCKLRGLMDKARKTFMATLDGQSLSSIL